jgi:O-antigen ligase
VARIEIGDIAPKQGVSGWTLVNMVYKSLEGTPIEKYGVARKAFGTFNFPSIAASVITIIYPIPIAFISLSRAKNRCLKLCLYFVIILSPICILLSGMRGALIAVFLFIPATLLLMGRRYGQKQLKVRLAAFAATVLLFGLLSLAVLPVTEHWKERFSREDFVQNSLNFRLLIYKIGIRSLSFNPLLGVGWGNGDKFSLNLLKGNAELELYTTGLHNGYIAILIETGIIGLAIYVLWYILLLRASFRKINSRNRSDQFAFLGGVFVIIVIQMLLVDTQGAFLRTQAEYMHFCLCLSFLRGFDDIAKEDNLERLS